MIAAVCYADDVYIKSLKWNARFAKWFGKCNEVYAYNNTMLPADFVKKNERYFKYDRGGGYWIWKSFIVKEVYDKLEKGDYLVYSDAGTLFLKPVKRLIKIMERDNQEIMCFETCGLLDREWTKRDVFVAMDCDKAEIYNTTQRMSTIFIIKKTDKTQKFVNDFVEYSQTDMIITDEPNIYGKDNYDGFRENRHDQSIFSLLTKKNGIIAYRDPSQWGNIQKIQYKKRAFRNTGEYDTYERSNYPKIILHHRYKEINLHNILAFYYHYWKLYRTFKRNPYQ